MAELLREARFLPSVLFPPRWPTEDERQAQVRSYRALWQEQGLRADGGALWHHLRRCLRKDNVHLGPRGTTRLFLELHALVLALAVAEDADELVLRTASDGRTRVLQGDWPARWRQLQALLPCDISDLRWGTEGPAAVALRPGHVFACNADSLARVATDLWLLAEPAASGSLASFRLWQASGAPQQELPFFASWAEHAIAQGDATITNCLREAAFRVDVGASSRLLVWQPFPHSRGLLLAPVHWTDATPWHGILPELWDSNEAGWTPLLAATKDRRLTVPQIVRLLVYRAVAAAARAAQHSTEDLDVSTHHCPEIGDPLRPARIVLNQRVLAEQPLLARIVLDTPLTET